MKSDIDKESEIIIKAQSIIDIFQFRIKMLCYVAEWAIVLKTIKNKYHKDLLIDFNLELRQKLN